jgi:acyl carrier protein
LTTSGAIPRAEDVRRVDLTMASVAEKVKQVIAEKLQIDAGQVTMEASIVEDLGADSLEQADILFSLEDEFGITADDTDEAEGLKTVGDIVTYLEKKVAAGA